MSEGQNLFQTFLAASKIIHQQRLLTKEDNKNVYTGKNIYFKESELLAIHTLLNYI